MEAALQASYLAWIAAMAGAFLCGSVPFGLLIARLLGGHDPRAAGSGNIGATNVARVAGKTAGALTLLLDAAKGAVPVAVLLAARASPALAYAAGLAAVLGHVFTPWLGFRGGKGVATALGVFAVVSPLAALAAVAVFALVVALTRMASAGSLAACLLIPAFVWFDTNDRSALALAIAITAIVIARHRDNIKRLWMGQEHRF